MASNDSLVLLIEHDEVEREVIRGLVEDCYQLEEVATGAEGIAAIAVERPSLVLLDNRLPDIESFDLLEQLVTERIPVIVLARVDDPEVIVAAMHRGAQNYLIREHLDKETLAGAIKDTLERVALQRELEHQSQQLSEPTHELAVRNRQIRTLASALTLAEQRERKRIAAILHDHVQQLLFGAQMRLHLLREDLPSDVNSEVIDHATDATKFVEEAIEVTRTLSGGLSPPIPKEEGIGPALSWLGRYMDKIHGLHVDVKASAEYFVESDELHILVVQWVHELLFNVVKHANVKEAEVSLSVDGDTYKIRVEDEGVGFEMGEVVQPQWKPQLGYGLYSVRERVTLFGGHLDIDSHPGNGACVTIILPEHLSAELN